jgi:hypothetical protein
MAASLLSERIYPSGRGWKTDEEPRRIDGTLEESGREATVPDRYAH